MSELLIIGVVALVVVGPKELPQLLRTLGQWIGKARRMAGEFQSQMNEAIREADLEDVKKSVDDLRALSPKAILANQFASVTEDLGRVERDTRAEFSGIRSDLSATAETPATEGGPEMATVADEAAASAELAERIDAAVDLSAAAPLDLGTAAVPVEAKKEQSV